MFLLCCRNSFDSAHAPSVQSLHHCALAYEGQEGKLPLPKLNLNFIVIVMIMHHCHQSDADDNDDDNEDDTMITIVERL